MCMDLDRLWFALWYWKTLDFYERRFIRERLLSEGRWFSYLRRERLFREFMASMGLPDLEYEERMREAEQLCAAVRKAQ